MTHTFTTLRHPVEKLVEGEHFLTRMLQSNGLTFQFELNAFLSASRSVTLVLQKTMAGVVGFDDWYVQRQAAMKADPAMRFFIELRNISQKEGPVSFVGGSLRSGRWAHRFVGNSQAVPENLKRRDIGACCGEHLAKLANLLLDCTSTFPFHSCPARALTEEGMEELGYDWRDVEASLGLPRGSTDLAPLSADEKFSFLRREIEPLDTESIIRIAASQPHESGGDRASAADGNELVDDIASMLAAQVSKCSVSPRNLFLSAILKRIGDIERS